MLASKASMMFPALLFEADSYFYSAFLTPEHLHHERRGAMKRLPGQELVDSAGRRFRIDTVVNPERIGPRWTAWLEGKVLREPLCRFDMELTELPPITFTDVLHLVMEKEAEAEGYHLWRGVVRIPKTTRIASRNAGSSRTS